MNVSPELKARILEAAAREPSPTRPAARARGSLVAAGAVAAALLLFYALGGPHIEPRPVAFVAGTVGGWALLAGIVAWLAFARGRSMLGRRGALLVALAVGTPALLFGWMLLWNLEYPETMAAWPGRVGLRCLSFTLAMSAWPLVVLARVRRERDPLHPGLTGAARGVAAGALAGIVVDLWCPIANPEHVLLGHILPIAILMALGALVGRTISGVRTR